MLCLTIRSIGEAAGLEINSKGTGLIPHRTVRAASPIRLIGGEVSYPTPDGSSKNPPQIEEVSGGAGPSSSNGGGVMSAAFTVPMYDAKFTAAVIVGDHCPKPLIDLGKRVATHLEKSEKYADKAEQHRITAGQLLTQAAAACDEGGFDAFIEKFCPNVGRSRVFELKAIATGKKSVEDIRASSRERQARCRSGKKAAESVTPPVTNSTPNDDEIERDRKECVGLYEKVVEAEAEAAAFQAKVKAAIAGTRKKTGGKTAPTTTNDTDSATSADQRRAYYADHADGHGGEDHGDHADDHDDHNDDDQRQNAQDDPDGDARPVDGAAKAHPGGSTAPAPSAKSKTKKPSPADFWESSPEDRETFRELVVEEYFALASGANILKRIRAAHKKGDATTITDFLDALTVDGMKAAMSEEFGKQLRAKLNPKKPKPFSTLQGHGDRSRPH